MTVAEAARVLGLTRQAVVVRLRRGQMRGVQVHPRLWMIPKSEVERWRVLGKQRPGRKPRQQRGEVQP